MKFPGIENLAKSQLFEQLTTQAHIWFFRSRKTLSDDRRLMYLSLLSAEEKKRYHGFRFSDDKQNYLIAHALLRVALSKYVDVAPPNWSFTCDEQGKPVIDGDQQLPAIDFNITHTGGLCACVITLDAAAGIDAENITRACNHKGLAQRMFSEQECALLSVSEQPEKQFYKYWTLREAYFKAIGSGLSGSSKDFSFLLNKNDCDIAIDNINYPEENTNCQLALYEPTDEHVLSVALKKKKAVPLQQKQLLIREVFVLSEAYL